MLLLKKLIKSDINFNLLLLADIVRTILFCGVLRYVIVFSLFLVILLVADIYLVDLIKVRILVEYDIAIVIFLVKYVLTWINEYPDLVAYFNL